MNVDDLSTARARLERVEADICGNFKKLGVKCRSSRGWNGWSSFTGSFTPAAPTLSGFRGI